MNAYSFIDVDKWAKDNDWKCPHCSFIFDRHEPRSNLYYPHVVRTCVKQAPVESQINELNEEVKALWNSYHELKQLIGEMTTKRPVRDIYKIHQEKALEIIDANPLVNNTVLAQLVVSALQDKVTNRLSINRLRYLFGKDETIKEKRGAYAHLYKDEKSI